MTSTRQQLIEEIERFLAISGMSPSEFGQEACGDDGILRRLKSGSQVRIDTADKIRKYIESWRPTTITGRPSRRPGRRGRYNVQQQVA